MSADAVISGLYAGAIYALVALGLTIVFQPTRVLNFAQGEAFVLGAAVAYQVVTLLHWGWVAAFAIMIVLAVVIGIVMERMIMLPVKLSGSRFAWIIASLAAALIFQSLFTLRYFNVDAFRPVPMIDGDLTVFGARIGWQQLITFVAVIAVVVFYDRFLARTVYGRAIRAAADDSGTSALMGIPVQRIILLSFVIGTVVTALAGFLAAPVIFIAPAAGLLFTIKGFVAAVIGGVGSPRGALVGGFIVGVLDNVMRTLIGGSFGNFAVFIAMALILVLFPAGLFGKPMEGH